jgi:hypothetical protein
MIAGKNMIPRGTYQILGLVEAATPVNKALIMTPPNAWKTMINVTRAALRPAGDSSAA